MFANIGLDAKIVPILGYGIPQNSHWQASNPQFRFPEIADGMAIDAAKANEVNGEKVKADAITAYYGKAPEKIVEKQLFTFEENTEFSELHTQISACTTPTIAAFITGEKDIDKEWDAFQKELKDLGVDRYLELSQISYDRFEKGVN
jgi:putative aldouronate transport system substrate-binding protein